MTQKKNFFIIVLQVLVGSIQERSFDFQSNNVTRTGDADVRPPDKQIPSSSVTIAMLISETVYKIIVIIERIIRWFIRAILRPYLFLFRCLIW